MRDILIIPLAIILAFAIFNIMDVVATKYTLHYYKKSYHLVRVPPCANVKEWRLGEKELEKKMEYWRAKLEATK